MTPEHREWLKSQLKAIRQSQALPSAPEPVDNAPMEGQAADDDLQGRVQAKTRELYGGSTPNLPLACPEVEFKELTVRPMAMRGDWLDLLLDFQVNGEPRQMTLSFPAVEMALYRLSREAIEAVTGRVAKAILAELSRK